MVYHFHLGYELISWFYQGIGDQVICVLDKLNTTRSPTMNKSDTLLYIRVIDYIYKHAKHILGGIKSLLLIKTSDWAMYKRKYMACNLQTQHDGHLHPEP